MTNQLTLTVDDIEVSVPRGATVMDACKAAEKEIPHFCYHERLSVAGNCRMCLVEVEGAPKPVASCHWPAADGMKVKTKGTVTAAARKGTMAFLLANHPLDCPICDQAGECDLQDQAVAYGADVSHYEEAKRAVDDKDIGEKIKTVMTRCIHCTRCVRFATEIAGVEEFGGTGRGENMQIGTYVEKSLSSELAGNMIDLCPVGALTSKPYAFTARPWELTHTNSIDMTDPTGANIRIDSRQGQVMRITPRENAAVNEEWMADMGRFSYDALTHNRLTSPMMRNKKTGKLNACSWPEAFAKIKASLKGVKPSKIAGLMGDMHTAEDAYAFNAFMKQTLKTDNVDCRHDGIMTDASMHASYIMNTPLEALETADAILLIGCNPRQSAPLVNTRIRKAIKNHNAQIASIGASDMDLTYAYQHISDNPADLEKFMDGKHAFAKTLKKAERPAVIIGGDILARKDGNSILFLAGVLATHFNVIKSGWNGFNVLLSPAGRINGLDMGVVPQSGGLTAPQVKLALSKNKLDALIQYGDIATLESHEVTTVYIGTHLTDQAKSADILLPSATYTEKNGLSANIEGRVQQLTAAVQPPLNAKEDWKIFRALSESLGSQLPFDHIKQLQELITDHCPAYGQPNTLLAAQWPKDMKGIGKVGSLSGALLTNSAHNPYLAQSYLQQSPTMHKMAAEFTAAQENEKEAA